MYYSRINPERRGARAELSLTIWIIKTDSNGNLRPCLKSKPQVKRHWMEPTSRINPERRGARAEVPLTVWKWLTCNMI